MTSVDARGNLHDSGDGRFATKPRSDAAGALPPTRSAAQNALDELATYLALQASDSEVNEVAADAVGAAGIGLRHPGSDADADVAFWRAYAPTAERGTPERALQEIGKRLGSQRRWPRGSDMIEFYAFHAREGGGVVDPAEEDSEDAIARIDDELKAIGEERGDRIVTLAAGALARLVRDEIPDAAVLEVSNALADDGEVLIQADVVYDQNGRVLARYVPHLGEPPDHFDDYSIMLDRNFATLRADSLLALERVPIEGASAPSGEDDRHFIHLDEAIERTGPAL